MGGDGPPVLGLGEGEQVGADECRFRRQGGRGSIGPGELRGRITRKVGDEEFRDCGGGCGFTPEGAGLGWGAGEGGGEVGDGGSEGGGAGVAKAAVRIVVPSCGAGVCVDGLICGGVDVWRGRGTV